MISFDADGTLIDLGFADTFWEVEVPTLYASKKGLKFEDAFRFVKSSYDEVGDEDLRWYQPKYWFERFGLEEDPHDVLKRVTHKVKIFPDAWEAVKNLHGKYELVVVSNAPREFLDIGVNDLKDYFSKIYSCTSDFGMVRKKPEVYIKICEELGVEPEDLIHVGDHYKFDYQVPRSIGIDAYCVNRENGKYSGTDGSDKIIKELTELLDKLS